MTAVLQGFRGDVMPRAIRRLLTATTMHAAVWRWIQHAQRYPHHRGRRTDSGVKRIYNRVRAGRGAMFLKAEASSPISEVLIALNTWLITVDNRAQ